LSDALFVSVEINLVLAIFNMLPLPPLDGSKVLAGLLPDALALPYLRLGRYGFLVLLLLLIFLPVLGQRLGVNLDLFSVLVQKPAQFLLRLLLGPLAA
jgi:Zn-dependent protease